MVFSSLTAHGAGETEYLTLSFGSPGINNLTAADIYLNPVGIGAVMGDLTRINDTTYRLAVSNITAGGPVSVNKEGRAFKPAPRTATVHSLGTSVTMTAWQTGGSDSAAASKTTTGLALMFSQGIDGLEEGDITLAPSPGGGNSGISISSGTLMGGGIGYSFQVNGIDRTGYITVSVTKSGYSIPAQNAVQVYYADEVAFSIVMPNGIEDTEPTTQLTLKFNKDITGLGAGDITLSEYNNGKGAFSRTGKGTYTLDVSGVNAAEEITVTVGGKSGYIISPPSQTVTPHIGRPALQKVEANGLSEVNTTNPLTLTFDKDIIGLTAGNIALSGCGAQKGTLSGSGKTWYLGVSGINTNGETVTVKVNSSPVGYAINNSPKTVTVNRFVLSQISAEAHPMAKGGTTNILYEGGTYYEIHTFTESGTLAFTWKPAGTVRVLVVGGGGGGGSGGWTSYVWYGGGAGGYVYHPSFDLGNDYRFPVIVGAGAEGNVPTNDTPPSGGDS